MGLRVGTSEVGKEKSVGRYSTCCSTRPVACICVQEGHTCPVFVLACNLIIDQQ
jgi:hypothetical protein